MLWEKNQHVGHLKSMRGSVTDPRAIDLPPGLVIIPQLNPKAVLRYGDKLKKKVATQTIPYNTERRIDSPRHPVSEVICQTPFPKTKGLEFRIDNMSVCL